MHIVACDSQVRKLVICESSVGLDMNGQRPTCKLYRTLKMSRRYNQFAFMYSSTTTTFYEVPQWGAADAEIKVPSGENTELRRSSVKAWGRSVYSHTCYAYCQGFLPCLHLPFRSIHLHFFQNLSRFLLCWLWLTHGSCVGPQNKIGHPSGCRFPC